MKKITASSSRLDACQRAPRMKLNPAACGRREALTCASALLLLPHAPFIRVSPCIAADALGAAATLTASASRPAFAPRVAKLLETIPAMPFGAPATNATLSTDLVQQASRTPIFSPYATTHCFPY